MIYEDCEGSEWCELIDGTFGCSNSKYLMSVGLAYLIAEFGPLKELEAA
jgi:hypothetical protein